VVVREGQVVGLITLRNIGEMLAMDQALRQSRIGPAERSV
jgi:hypothetical protein